MITLHAAVVALATLGAGDAVLLDFYADWCGPCQQMAPTVDSLAALGYPVRKVNVDHEKQLASQFRVEGIPCFVLVVDGREVDRVVGNASSDSLKRLFEKAGVGPAGSMQPAAAIAQAPPAVPRARSLDSFIPGMQQTPAPTLQHAPAALPIETAAAPFDGRQNAPAVRTGPSSIRVNSNDLLASSVRLKIEDGSGHSYGSGTIIDFRGDQALVLTCGHVFRDSEGKGRVAVDMFGPGAPQGVEGQIVGYDLKSDVGLVCFRPGVPVRAARVAPSQYRPERGAPVVNIGCDHGNDPTVRESRITAIDKYCDAPNIEVAGQPVQGRSGGGLFDADGLVIGVCNAADPQDDEGLYAATASIHALLDREGLASVYQQAANNLAQATANEPQPLGQLVAVTPPNMPSRMPAAVPASAPRTNDRVPAESYAQQPRAALNQSEQAALDGIRLGGKPAEVVCIVRPLADPQAKSQIIVLNNASPQFMEQLASEQRMQGAPHLTSLAVQGPTATRSAAAPAPKASRPRPAGNPSLVWQKASQR